jgi:hypothetical protein
MTTLTIKIPDNGAAIIKDISSLVKSVGGDISVLPDKEAKKEELKAELKQSLHEAFDIVEGKAPRKTLRDILNG